MEEKKMQEVNNDAAHYKLLKKLQNAQYLLIFMDRQQEKREKGDVSEEQFQFEFNYVKEMISTLNKKVKEYIEKREQYQS